MPRTLLLVTAALLTGFVMVPALPAHADVFTYACKANGKRSVIRIDDTAHKLVWNGKTYAIKDAKEGDCPRFGWNVAGNGKTFDFCTATQGMADFHLDGRDVQCDQKN